MKAIMPLKPAETANIFRHGGVVRCPNCGNTTRSDLVVIEIREHSLEEDFYTADDWHGG